MRIANGRQSRSDPVGGSRTTDILPGREAGESVARVLRAEPSPHAGCRCSSASAAAMRALLAAVSSSATIWIPAAIAAPMIAPMSPKSAPNASTLASTVKAELGRLSDDRQLQDVVLDLLVDHDHDHDGDHGFKADRQRDEPDDDAGDHGPDAGDEVEEPRDQSQGEGVWKAEDLRCDAVDGRADHGDGQVAEHVARGRMDDPIGDLQVPILRVLVEQASIQARTRGSSISPKSVRKRTER